MRVSRPEVSSHVSYKILRLVLGSCRIRVGEEALVQGLVPDGIWGHSRDGAVRRGKYKFPRVKPPRPRGRD